jgi:hypothetical protein
MVPTLCRPSVKAVLGATPTAQLAGSPPGRRPVDSGLTAQSGVGSSHPMSVLSVTAQRPIARTVRLANTRAGAAGRTEENP